MFAVFDAVNDAAKFLRVGLDTSFYNVSLIFVASRLMVLARSNSVHTVPSLPAV